MSTMTSAVYREATLADVDAIHAVATATWAHDYPDVVTREAVTDAVEDWYGADQLAADVRRGDALVLVAERTDAERTDVERTDAERTDVERTDAERTDAEPTDTDVVVGFVHGIVDDDRGVVLRAYVHPDARDAGVGRGLVDAVTDQFRNRGCTSVEAFVLARNDAGNAFYRALGFEHVTTESTTIDGDGYDEHCYLRYL